MSRRQAAQTIPAKSLMRMMGNIVYQKDRVDALRDEAPMAYKNLNEVMQVQSDLVRTEQILRTVLNYKGG